MAHYLDYICFSKQNMQIDRGGGTMVGWVVSRNASSPSLSGNRRCQDGLGVSTLEPNCPSVFPLILLLPSRSYFLREEISLARLFLILVATYFQKHANRKLHYIAHKIGSHITKSPILDWLPLLTKSTIHLKLTLLPRWSESNGQPINQWATQWNSASERDPLVHWGDTGWILGARPAFQTYHVIALSLCSRLFFVWDEIKGKGRGKSFHLAFCTTCDRYCCQKDHLKVGDCNDKTI